MMGLSYVSSLSSGSFLVDESHGQLSDVDGVILIVLLLSVLVYYIQLILLQHCLLFVTLRSTSRSLDRSESPANLGPTVGAAGSSWRDHAYLLRSGLLLCLHFYTHLVRPLSTDAHVVARAIGCGWEETLAVTSLVVSSVVESSLCSASLGVNCRCGGSCDTCGMGGVRVLSLDWLHN